MTYRPIGIAPLRNYDWELSNHLCAPSRQVKRPRKKRHERYFLWRTRILRAEAIKESRFSLQFKERSPRACSIRGVNYAIRRRSRRIIYKLTQETLLGELYRAEHRSPILFYRDTLLPRRRICTWHLTKCYGFYPMQLANCVNKRGVIRHRIGMTSTSLATFVPQVLLA